MLKYLRKHTKIVVWAVVITFALWGGFSATSLKKELNYAGSVYGKNVSFQEYNKFYKATQIFMPSPELMRNPDALRSYVWQNIIYAKEAKRQGIKVSDKELRAELSRLLASQGLINPSPQVYKNWLERGLRISPREFEESLREFIAIQKLIRMQTETIELPVSEDVVSEEIVVEERDKQNAFMMWTLELNKKANLVDYAKILAEKQSSEEEIEADTDTNVS